MLLHQQPRQVPVLGGGPGHKQCYLRPLPPRKQRIKPCQYAVLESTSDFVSSELVKGLMLSAVTTSAIRKATSALARKAAVDAFVTKCCIQFNVSDKDELQDLLAALILSECVYKKLEMPPEQLAQKISEFLAEFPLELVHIEAVQLSLEDVTQNYLVAVGGRSVYVAFMGTKQARDVQTDLAFNHEAVWAAEEMAGRASEVPSAHRGFLARAKSVPIKQLQALAEGSGRRLVLCGHSLGGAVAKLVGLKLLRESPEWLPPPSLRVICFATPAVGNDALASLVEAAGWSSFFKTYVLPEDQLMRMLRFTVAAPTAAPTAAAAAAVVDTATSSSSTSGSPAGTSVVCGTAARSAAAVAGNSSNSSSSNMFGGSSAVAAGVEAVAGLLKRPFVQENAKEQLRKELRDEEANTTTLDSAAMDLADAAAAAAATSSSSRRSIPGFRLASRFWSRQQQQQHQLPDQAVPMQVDASMADDTAAATTVHTPQAADGSSSSSSSAPDTAAAVPSASDAGVANIGLVMRLQGNWVAYQLSQMGRVAMSPLTTAKRAVSQFHPFGQYEYITCQGVTPLDRNKPLDPNAPLEKEAAAFQDLNPGPFNFHRMVAYRTRCFQIINKIAAELAEQGLGLQSAAAAAGGGSSSGVGFLAVPKEWQMMHPVVKLGTVLPRMRVTSGFARPPLRSPSLLLPAAAAEPSTVPDSSAAASSNSSSPPPAAAAVPASRRGALAFLPVGRGSRPLEPSVQLMCKVMGSNLHLCRKVGVLVFGEQYQPTVLISNTTSQHGFLLQHHKATAATSWADGSSSSQAAMGQQQQQGSSSSAFAPLSMLAPVFSRVKQAAVAAARAYEGDRPRWRIPTDTDEELTLQIMLPASTVDRLLAAVAGSSSSSQQQQQQQQEEGFLIIQFKSDFEVLSVPVQLKPHVVGIIGSSSRAAAVVQTLLAHSGELQQQYQQQLAAVASAASAGSGAKSSAGLQRWLPQPQKWISTRQQQQQQQPVNKVKAAANLAAAAGASVAAARLSTLSKQLLGRRGSAAAGLIKAENEPLAKKMRTAAAASSSMGSMSSYEESAAAAAALQRRPLPPAIVSSSSSSSNDLRKPVAQQVPPAAQHLQQHAAGSSSSRNNAVMSDTQTLSSNATPAAAAKTSGNTTSSSSRRKRGGLSGVVYTTLPIKTSPLLLPTRPAAAAAVSSTHSNSHSLYQVLRQATKQLQQQQQQQQQPWVGSGILSSAKGLADSAVKAAGRVAAAAAESINGVLAGSSSSSSEDAGLGTEGHHAVAAAAVRSPAAAAGKGVSKRSAAARRQQYLRNTTLAAARSKQQQQQQQHWDVLLLPVTWDADYIRLMKCRPALSALAAAAAAAGVRIVPLLLLEGDESLMTVATADLDAAGLRHHSRPLLSDHDQMTTPSHSSNLQGLLSLDDAAAQLAAAVHLPASQVIRLPLQGLVNPLHFPGSSSSRSSWRSNAGSPSSAAAAADLLRSVGGVDHQQRLLLCIKKLEGHLAGLLQQQLDASVGLPPSKL